MKKVAYIFSSAFIVLIFLACTKEMDDVVQNRALKRELLNVDYSDLIQKANANSWIPVNTTNARIALGRVLFYDTQLSFNNTVSCGSCHKQNLAFSDNTNFSPGFKGVLSLRNSKPIQNILPQGQPLFWDGRADSLGQLVTMPIQDHIEMGFEKVENMPAKLNRLSYYPELFADAYGSADITVQRITIAMRDFIIMMQSHNSRFEDGRNNGGVAVPPGGGFGFNIWDTSDVPTLTREENDGMRLFIGKARCANCHSGRDLEGWDNANTGLDLVYTDQGMGKRFAGMEGVFRIPALRNIELTAPYMHDGRFKTLEEVVDFYDHGVQAHENLDWRMRDIPGGGSPFADSFVEPNNQNLNQFGPLRLNLTTYEKGALVAFLKTLTDKQFTTDQRLSNPFRAN